jgi:hypothetical protein
MAGLQREEDGSFRIANAVTGRNTPDPSGWKNSAGQAAEGSGYVPGGRSRPTMTKEEEEALKKKRPRTLLSNFGTTETFG